VSGIGFRVSFITIRLPRLSQENEGSGIGCLKTECQVQQYEGVRVKFCVVGGININPTENNDRLSNQENWSSEKRANFSAELANQPVPKAECK
jgi:hypothetical protein